MTTPARRKRKGNALITSAAIVEVTEGQRFAGDVPACAALCNILEQVARRSNLMAE